MFKHLYYCVIQYVQLNELGGEKRRLLNKLDSDLIWQITMFKKKCFHPGFTFWIEFQ